MVQTLAAFAVGVMVALGIYLLARRARDAAKRRAEPFKGLYEGRNKQFIEKLLNEDAGQAPNAAEIERTFRNLFFTTADKGEGLIEYYMTRNRCGRIEAMRLAVQAREREDKRYD